MDSYIQIPGTITYTHYALNGTYLGESKLDTWSKIADTKKPDPPRERKPDGWLYPKPYDAHYNKLVRANGHLRFQNGYYGVIQTESGPATYASDGWRNAKRVSVTPAMIDRAVTKALIKLKDQKINLGVAMAEAQMTADLVGSVGTRLAKLYRLVKQRRWNEAADFIDPGHRGGRKVPKSWLEFQYGWLPLLNDVNGAVKATQDAAGIGNCVVTVKAKESEEETWDEYYDPDQPLDRMRVRGMSDAGVTVRLDYEPDNDMLATFASLGLTNPAEIAWELVPYSFVVDWFLPIGNWLSVLDATVGYKFRSGSRSERHRYHETGKRMPYNQPGYVYSDPHWEGTDYLRREVSLKRTVYATSPLPVLPRPKNPLSLTHMANGLSLLSQAFSGRR